MPRKTHDTQTDRNFDDLAHRFKRNVYDQLKGDIRLAVLQRDLADWLSEDIKDAHVWDAGGGQGQFALELAARGCQIDLCDISHEMLQLAQERAQLNGFEDKFRFYHQSIQAFSAASEQLYDLVVCHAVLEWVVDPESVIDHLISRVKPGGLLSITFYNVHGLAIKNLLRTNFKKVIDQDYTGYRGSLTPTFPRDPDEVIGWLGGRGLKQQCHSGIRCFHDYILSPEERISQPEAQLELELRLSQQEPYRSMARYVHVLSKKSLA